MLKLEHRTEVFALKDVIWNTASVLHDDGRHPAPTFTRSEKASYRLPDESSARVTGWVGGVRSKRMVSVFAKQKPLDLRTSTG